MNPIVVERTAVLDRGTPNERSIRQHYYWCPGCDALHAITIRPDVNGKGAGWTFTGTLDRPTYAPSQLTRYAPFGKSGRQYVCHTFIRDGMIQFLNDCTHSLKGQTVPLPPLPAWAVKI